MAMIPLSILDLCPINEGGSVTESIINAVDLARHADRWGFTRYWMAEHHGMPGIASAATSVLIGHVAGATSRIRVGAGGIMLPNHSPLQIAEQFGTLDAMYPRRIDLGVGRAPGSDQVTSRALRRGLSTDPDEFPRDVMELIAYFEGNGPVRAVPGEGHGVPIWILGSSLFGAQLAAMLGLPYAFASHFCAGADAGCDRRVSRALPAVAPSGQALRDVGFQCGGCRHGYRGALLGFVLAAVLRQSSLRSPGAPAAAGGRLCRIPAAAKSHAARSGAVMFRNRLALRGR